MDAALAVPTAISNLLVTTVTFPFHIVGFVLWTIVTVALGIVILPFRILGVVLWLVFAPALYLISFAFVPFKFCISIVLALRVSFMTSSLKSYTLALNMREIIDC